MLPGTNGSPRLSALLCASLLSLLLGACNSGGGSSDGGTAPASPPNPVTPEPPNPAPPHPLQTTYQSTNLYDDSDRPREIPGLTRLRAAIGEFNDDADLTNDVDVITTGRNHVINHHIRGYSASATASTYEVRPHTNHFTPDNPTNSDGSENPDYINLNDPADRTSYDLHGFYNFALREMSNIPDSSIVNFSFNAFNNESISDLAVSKDMLLVINSGDRRDDSTLPLDSVLQYWNLDRTIFVSSVEADASCNPADLASCFTATNQATFTCGAEVQEHCMVAWYHPERDYPNSPGTTLPFNGSYASAPVVGAIADNVLALWPDTTIADLKALILGCAIDLGDPGTDAVYGRGMLSLGCLFQPVDGTLYTAAPAPVNPYLNSYRDTRFYDYYLHGGAEPLGLRRLRDAVAYGAIAPGRTSKLNMLYTPASDTATPTVSAADLSNIALRNVLRTPQSIAEVAYTTEGERNTAVEAWLGTLTPGSIAYLPYANINTGNIIRAAQANDLLLVIPGSASGTVDQCATDPSPCTLDNTLLVATSVFLDKVITAVNNDADAHTHINPAPDRLDVGSPTGNTLGCPNPDSADTNLADLYKCYTKITSLTAADDCPAGDFNCIAAADCPIGDTACLGSLTVDCGEALAGVCITGNNLVKQLSHEDAFSPNNGSTHLTLEVGSVLQGARYAAAQVAAVADALLALWPTALDPVTNSNALRNLILDCALDGGSPGVDSVWGQGQLSVGCLFNPADGLLYSTTDSPSASDISTGTTSYQNTPMYSATGHRNNVFDIPGLRRLDHALRDKRATGFTPATDSSRLWLIAHNRADAGLRYAYGGESFLPAMQKLLDLYAIRSTGGSLTWSIDTADIVEERVQQLPVGSIAVLAAQQANSASVHALSVARDLLITLPTGDSGASAADQFTQLGRFIFVSGAAPRADLTGCNSSNLSACLNLHTEANGCGEAFKEHCLTAWYDPSSGTSTGTAAAAAQVAAAADAVLVRWDSLSNAQLKDIILECAEDVGTPGTDATYGRGILSLSCLFEPSAGLLTTTTPDHTPAYRNDYTNTGYRSSLDGTEIIGWARVRDAVALGAQQVSTISNLHIVTPYLRDNNVYTQHAETLIRAIAATNGLRVPSIYTSDLKSQAELVATVPGEALYLQALMETMDNGSVLYIPYFPYAWNANSSTYYTDSVTSIIAKAKAKNHLLVVPVESNSPSTVLDNVLFVASAKFNSALPDCPASDIGLDTADLADCYEKDSSTQDCGSNLQTICITGNYSVNSLQGTIDGGDYQYTRGGSSTQDPSITLSGVADNAFSALQVAAAVDALRAIWPSVLNTGEKLREVILACALDAGAAGTDSTWGRGIASLDCLFNPSDGLLYTRIYNSIPLYSGITTAREIIGLNRLRDAIDSNFSSRTFDTANSRLQLLANSDPSSTWGGQSHAFALQTVLNTYEVRGSNSFGNALWSGATATTEPSLIAAQVRALPERSIAVLAAQDANTTDIHALSVARDLLVALPAGGVSGSVGTSADQLGQLGQFIFVAGASQTTNCDTSNLSSCFDKHLYANPCGDAFKNHCLMAWYNQGLSVNGVGANSSTSYNISDSASAAALVAQAADTVLTRWSGLSNIALKDIILGCAEDLGPEGVDATYGHGMLSLGCLFRPTDGLLYTGIPTAAAPAYSKDYTGTGLHPGPWEGELIGWARLRDAVALGALQVSRTSRLQIATPAGDGSSDPVQQRLGDVAAVNSLRIPTETVVTSVGGLENWLDGLTDGSVAYIPYENANTAAVIAKAVSKNLLLVVPAEGEEDQAASAAQQLNTSNHGTALNNLLVVGSARYNSSLPGCPANDVGLTITELANCFQKDAASTGAEGTDDCGYDLRSICLTGNFEVSRMLRHINSSDRSTASGSRYAALQIAAAADALLELWPTQLNTADRLRQLLLDCALDAGDPSLDDRWGHGLASLSCLFNPVGGALYTQFPTPAPAPSSYETLALYSFVADSPHQIPGWEKLVAAQSEGHFTPSGNSLLSLFSSNSSQQQQINQVTAHFSLPGRTASSVAPGLDLSTIATSSSILGLPFTQVNNDALHALAVSRNLLLVVPTGNDGNSSADQHSQNLGRTLLVGGIAPGSNCDRSNLASCFAVETRANACGTAFMQHCLVAWYDTNITDPRRRRAAP